jgi:hypothetical protein
MADSGVTTLPDQVEDDAADKEAQINEALDAASPALLFGRRASTCTGLTWGYYGGKIMVAGTVTSIGNGTVALTASQTNYIEATAAGVVSANTSAYTVGRMKLYRAVTSSSAVTSYTDDRVQGLGSETTTSVSGPGSSTDNAIVRWDGTGGTTIQNSGVLVSDNNEISGYRGHVNIQTGTTYTVLSADAGKIIDHANGSAIAVTLPNSFPVGFAITYVQTGAGQITFASTGSGTVVNRQSHTKTAGNKAMVSLYVRTNSGTNAEWVLGGDTST